MIQIIKILKILRIFLPVILAACSGIPEKPPQDYFKDKHITPPAADTFTFCSQYGCKRLTSLTISPDDWTDIAQTYGPVAQNAQEEREKIAQTIGRFEQIIGARTGTDLDQAGTFRKIGKGQLDCVDESSNTTSYLMLLDGKGFIKFHTVGSPDTRFPIIHAGNWPHQTAIIIDKETMERYAVDSWFYDNGTPAVILPLKMWKEGWKPDNQRR